MNVVLSEVSRQKFHRLWGKKLKVSFETVLDKDAVIREIAPELKPEDCLNIGRDSKRIYHSAVVSDMMNADSGQTTFLCWADESDEFQVKGFRVCFRAQHFKPNDYRSRLLFKNVLFGRFNEEKPWSFERGPFMNLETFTYKNPFQTLYIKILEGEEVVYLKIDMELTPKAAFLKVKRIQAEDAPVHLISAQFP